MQEIKQAIKWTQDHQAHMQQATIMHMLNLFTFGSHLRIMDSLLAVAESELDELLITLDRAEQGKLSITTLNPRKLFKLLSGAAEQLPPGYSFLHPLRREMVHQFYTTSTVKVAVVNQTFRFFVEVLLMTASREFTLYEIMPFPYIDPSSPIMTYIQPNNPYLATTADGLQYVEMNERSLDDCYGITILICKPYKAIEKHPEPSCNIALFKKDTVMQKQYCSRRFTEPRYTFIRAEEANRWAFSVPASTRALVQCPNEMDVERIIFQDTGFISVEQGCQIVVDGHTLLPHNINGTHAHVHQDKFAIPALSHAYQNQEDEEIPFYCTNNTDLQGLLKHVSSHDFLNSDATMAELNRLSADLEVAKVQGFHDTWLKSLSSLVLVILIGLFLTVVWKFVAKWYKKRHDRFRCVNEVVSYHKHDKDNPVTLGAVSESVPLDEMVSLPDDITINPKDPHRGP